MSTARWSASTRPGDGRFAPLPSRPDRIDRTYAIDDADVDFAVRRCHHLAVVDTYESGLDSGLLLAGARQIVSLIVAERTPS